MCWFKYRNTQSNNCDVMCCLSGPTGKGSCQGCAAVAKVRSDAASAEMWFVEVTAPHSNDCAHRTKGLRRGAWLEEAGGAFIEQQYFEYRQSPSEIASKLQASPAYKRRYAHSYRHVVAEGTVIA